MNSEAVAIKDISRENDVSIEELRLCPLFKGLPDTEAGQVLETLKTYTQIIFDCYQKMKQKED